MYNLNKPIPILHYTYKYKETCKAPGTLTYWNKQICIRDFRCVETIIIKTAGRRPWLHGPKISREDGRNVHPSASNRPYQVIRLSSRGPRTRQMQLLLSKSITHQ